MEVIVVAIMSIACFASNILCFLIGARTGQKVIKGEEVKLPDPVEAVREHKTNREMKHKMSQLETIMQNVDSYDGTGFGQIDVPRG